MQLVKIQSFMSKERKTVVRSVIVFALVVLPLIIFLTSNLQLDLFWKNLTDLLWEDLMARLLYIFVWPIYIYKFYIPSYVPLVGEVQNYYNKKFFIDFVDLNGKVHRIYKWKSYGAGLTEYVVLVKKRIKKQQ